VGLIPLNIRLGWKGLPRQTSLLRNSVNYGCKKIIGSDVFISIVNVIILNVFIQLHVVMLIVVLLNVIILSVTIH
jgi:hypothetical protein